MATCVAEFLMLTTTSRKASRRTHHQGQSNGVKAMGIEPAIINKKSSRIRLGQLNGVLALGDELAPIERKQKIIASR